MQTGGALERIGQSQALERAGGALSTAAETLSEVEDLTSALGVLSAMITPAVLIAACSTLIIATSNRLGRVMDRTRFISETFGEMADGEAGAGAEEIVVQERALLFDQLDKATRRVALLQRAMTRLYLALSSFVLTSVAIGVEAATQQDLAWIPILLGILGAGFLFWSTVLLIIESRVALAAIDDEMAFIRRRGAHYAPAELRERRRRRRDLFRRRFDEE